MPNELKRNDLINFNYVSNQLRKLNVVAHYNALSIQNLNKEVDSVEVQKDHSSCQEHEIELPCEPKKKRRIPYTKQESRPGKESRYDNIGHLPNVDDIKSPTRCKMEGCRLKSHVVCIKCKVHLCLRLANNCFLKFHTETHDE